MESDEDQPPTKDDKDQCISVPRGYTDHGGCSIKCTIMLLQLLPELYGVGTSIMSDLRHAWTTHTTTTV